MEIVETKTRRIYFTKLELKHALANMIKAEYPEVDIEKLELKLQISPRDEGELYVSLKIVEEKKQ